MEDKIDFIKKWLGTGSINIFGIQFSGKDTLGVALAKALNANFLSSGDLVRAAAKADNESAEIKQAAIDSERGILTPTEQFRELIVPHLKDPELAGRPLVLSSVGRWYGEETVVMDALQEGSHELKAVIIMDISEDEVWRRWEDVKATRNGGRADDISRERIETRLEEFKEKTLPVINKYRQMNLTIDLNSERPVDEVFADAIDKIYNFAKKNVKNR